MERRVETYVHCMKFVVDWFRENPPPETEMELRSVLSTMQRQLRELEKGSSSS